MVRKLGVPLRVVRCVTQDGTTVGRIVRILKPPGYLAGVLVDRGGFLNQPDAGVVESLPFNGGKPSVLTHGAEPSWNR